MSVIKDVKNTKQKLIFFQTTYTPSLDIIDSEIPDGYKIVSLSVAPTKKRDNSSLLKDYETFLVVEPINSDK